MEGHISDQKAHEEQAVSQPQDAVPREDNDVANISQKLDDTRLEDKPGSEQSPPSAGQQSSVAPQHETVIINAPSNLNVRRGRGEGILRASQCELAKPTGLTRLGARYEVIPPGCRTSFPHAHKLEDELAYCISGEGVIWQNGWTYPFVVGDVASWKHGTGLPHTIINDSNRDGAKGEDLIILLASDKKNDAWWYPLSPERRAVLPDERAWNDGGKIPQNESGPHPGFPSKRYGSDVDDDLPRPLTGPRPSNIAFIPDRLQEMGSKDMFGHGTSLTRETHLGSGFGCNIEVLPPGTRSSYPHCHSLEEELVYILQGRCLLWLDGNTVPLGAGDFVGFPAGTGIAHTFINDTNANGEPGEDLHLWVLGENREFNGDSVRYPLNPELRAKSIWWEDCPIRELGPHNGVPSVPRQDD